MSFYSEIPLSPTAQVFNITLAGIQYTINLYWNEFNSVWCIDLLLANNTQVISGIPLVANVDLLEQYQYLNLGGKLVAQTDLSPNTAPTYDNLGSLGHVYFITP